MKIAVPVINGQMNPHFGHSAQFAVFTTAGGGIENAVVLDTPQQGHGYIPGWLAEMGVSVALVGGMGIHAQQAMAQAGIQVIGGVSGIAPSVAVEQYLRGNLTSGQPACGGHGKQEKHAGSGCGCGCGGH